MRYINYFEVHGIDLFPSVPVRRLPELFSAADSTERIIPEIVQPRTDGFRDDWQKEMNSPVERVFGSEQMRTFAQEMDLDLTQATIKPLD